MPLINSKIATCFRTKNREYLLEADKFVCNKFGIAEFIIDKINQRINQVGPRVLDVGCGAGPLSVFLSDQCNANVTGVEISGTACACCLNNIKKYGLSNKFRLINNDFRVFYEENLNEVYDLIVANPPLDENVSMDLVAKYSRENFACIRDAQAFSYVTNSWHDSHGRDLMDYIFMYGQRNLSEKGRIIIGFCELSCSNVSCIEQRGANTGSMPRIFKKVSLRRKA